MSHASEHDRGLRKRSVGREQPSAGHLQVEQHVQRLNDLLRAVRNVNQLIAREKDRDRLLGGACESLTATRGYQSVWIAVVDESQNLVTAAEAGVGEDLQRLLGPTEHGRWCDCARRALAQPGTLQIDDPTSACTDCPLVQRCSAATTLAVRLERAGAVHGVLVGCTAPDQVVDQEERALFEEVAGDLAFALENLRLEQERNQAEAAIISPKSTPGRRCTTNKKSCALGGRC